MNVDSAHTGSGRVPLAGGQYSMVSGYAPPGASKFLSYITGKRSRSSGFDGSAFANFPQAGSPA